MQDMLHALAESLAAGQGKPREVCDCRWLQCGDVQTLLVCLGPYPTGLAPGTRRRQPLVFIIPLEAWYLHPSTQKIYSKGSSIHLSGSAVGLCTHWWLVRNRSFSQWFWERKAVNNEQLQEPWQFPFVIAGLAAGAACVCLSSAWGFENNRRNRFLCLSFLISPKDFPIFSPNEQQPGYKFCLAPTGRFES